MKKYFSKYFIVITLGIFVGFAGSFYFFKAMPHADGENDKSQPSVSSGIQPKTPDSLVGTNLIADITANVSPAVVNIDWEKKVKQRVYDPFQDFGFSFGFGQDDEFKKFFTDRVVPIRGAGSGFIINKEGYILTNYHVVQQADKDNINVTLLDGRKLKGKILGQDSSLDLAIVKVASEKLPTVKLGDSSKIRPGEWVLAIGNPYQYSNTVTIGIISATGRELSDIDKHNLIQTDAAINPGNSGGPLINMNGEVIGINVAVEARAQGIGFAIPVNGAKAVLDDLINKGRVSRPWLGVYMRDVDDEIASYLGLPIAAGVIIVDVADESPAKKAGLQKYDIVKEINKEKVKSAKELQEKIKEFKPGSKVLLLVYREGRHTLLTVVIGEAP